MMELGALLLLTFGVLHCYISAVVGQRSISIRVTPDVITRGDDVHVVCTFKMEGPEPNEDSQAIYMEWVKRRAGKTFGLGANNYIDPLYRTRYKADVDYDYDNTNGDFDLSTFNFTLHIKDAQMEDIGEIGCREPNKDLEQFVKLIVYTPVQSVQILTLENQDGAENAYDIDEELISNEGQVRNISCLVLGGYPQPEVRIMLGKNDITESFSPAVKGENQGEVPALQSVSYEVVLTQETFTMEYEFDNKMLECRAMLPGSKLPPEVKRVRLLIGEYKPQFKCQTTLKTLYRPLQTNATIRCDVLARPETTDIRIFWKGRNPVSGKDSIASPADGGYKMDVQPGSTPFEQSATLFIENVSAEHYRTYFFEATNPLGTVKYSVKLRPDKSSPHRKAAVSGIDTAVCHPWWTMAVMYSILLVFTCQFNR